MFSGIHKKYNQRFWSKITISFLFTSYRYAIKNVDISNVSQISRFQREIDILRDIDHTNVVRLFETYWDKNTLGMVMEVCTGGNLAVVLRREGVIDEETAKNYVAQITRALHHCHERGIVHRDVKLQNILLESRRENAQLKLIDFGNAIRFQEDTTLHSLVGTTYTTAPEVFRGNYREKCDIWSLGVISFVLLCGKRPFDGIELPNVPNSRESSMIASIITGRVRFNNKNWEDVSTEGIHFVSCLLQKDVGKRFSAKEALFHIWLEDGLYNDMILKDDEPYRKTMKNSISRMVDLSDFKKSAMMAIAFSTPQKNYADMRELFTWMDADNNG